MEINNKARNASWKDIALEFQSERDALQTAVLRLQTDLIYSDSDAMRYRIIKNGGVSSINYIADPDGGVELWYGTNPPQKIIGRNLDDVVDKFQETFALYK